MCNLCFSPSSTHKHGATVAQFRLPFERDLNPSSPAFPSCLGDLAARLKAWRSRLASTLDATMPPFLHLEHEARNLQVCLSVGQVTMDSGLLWPPFVCHKVKGLLRSCHTMHEAGTLNL